MSSLALDSLCLGKIIPSMGQQWPWISFCESVWPSLLVSVDGHDNQAEPIRRERISLQPGGHEARALSSSMRVQE